MISSVNDPVAFDELLARCLGDAEFAQQMLEGFIASCPDHLNAFERDIDSGANAELAKKLHRMKGTAATLGARPMLRLLENLERMVGGETCDKSKMREQQADVVSEFNRLVCFVERMPAGGGD